MPLASKDGKLYFKTVTEIVDGEEVEVIKLCSSCCGDEVIGCCYTYSYDNSGNPIFIVSKDTYSVCEEIQNQVDPSFDVVWEKLNDSNAECPAEPPPPPPVPGICLYREDGKGVCKTYDIEQFDSRCYATAEECEAAIALDLELMSQVPENQSDCFDAIGGYVDTRVTPNPDSGCTADKPFLYATYFRKPSYNGPEGSWDGTCALSYSTNVTEEECTNFEGFLPAGISAEDAYNLYAPEWAVDYPDVNLGGWGPTHCKLVNSEEECEELKGIFCEGATECPDNPSAGCPDPNRSNPLP